MDRWKDNCEQFNIAGLLIIGTDEGLIFTNHHLPCLDSTALGPPLSTTLTVLSAAEDRDL